MRASLAINTQMAYKNAISAFNKFRSHHNLGCQWPAAVIHVQYFISSCFERGFSPATISSYCSGISFFHKINNLSDPTSTFIIQKMLEGCRRSRKHHDNRAPISKETLNKICSKLPQICSNQYETLLFTAAFTLAYYGLLRVSELVYTDPMHKDRPLQLSDVSYDTKNKTLILQIRKSKTDQAGKACKLTIHPADKGSICCINSVLLFMGVRPKIEGILLCHQNRDHLTRYQFTSILTKCISKLGVSTELIKSHSLRIGRATDLYKEGVATETIKTLGRWRFGAFHKYIRT